MKPTANHNHHEGSSHYFMPVCVKTEQGYTFHYRMGYEEISEEEAMDINELIGHLKRLNMRRDVVAAVQETAAEVRRLQASLRDVACDCGCPSVVVEEHREDCYYRAAEAARKET